jgi:hypothetical protein
LNILPEQPKGRLLPSQPTEMVIVLCKLTED